MFPLCAPVLCWLSQCIWSLKAKNERKTLIFTQLKKYPNTTNTFSLFLDKFLQTNLRPIYCSDHADRFGGHSTRAAITSAAASDGVLLHTALNPSAIADVEGTLFRFPWRCRIYMGDCFPSTQTTWWLNEVLTVLSRDTKAENPVEDCKTGNRR